MFLKTYTWFTIVVVVQPVLVFKPVSSFQVQSSNVRGRDPSAQSLPSETLELVDNIQIGVSMTRREICISSLFALLPVAPTLAVGEDDDPAILKVTVTLGSGVNLDQVIPTQNDNDNTYGVDGSSSAQDASSRSSQGPALYITARPITADNVPRAILDGSRGKPPPVLIARFPNVSSFPYHAILTAKDITVEGNTGAVDGEGASTTTTSSYTYWWQGQGLVVSARWDTDGVAATRDPTDLVGRALWNPSAGTAGKGGDDNWLVNVQLQGRGPAGKLFTSKKL